MKHRTVVLGLVLALMVWAAPARAMTITFEAILSGANEVLPTVSAGSGDFFFVFDDQGTAAIGDDTLSALGVFSGLGAAASAAHIHAPAPPGVNAPVVIPLTSFPNATSGSYSNTFSLGALGAGEAAFEASLLAGLAYVNIHTAIYPGGEIRGQLNAVPEPATLALIGAGLVGLVQARRRRNIPE